MSNEEINENMSNEEIIKKITEVVQLQLQQKDYIIEELELMLEEAEIETQRVQDRLTEVLKEYKNVGAKDGEEPTTIFQYADGTTPRDLKIKIKII
jgi:DNA-binding transcriptional regulator WhiA